MSFLLLLCEIRLDFETMLQNIRCFIFYKYIVIVVSFFALEYEVGKIK